MNEHVTDWLAAYHDGELHGARLLQVEAHLQECPSCRAEVEALNTLSALLQEHPAMPVRTSPERFVAQVRLRMPPAAASARLRTQPQAGWLLVPLGLFGLWAFLQAILVVSRIVLIMLPLFGGLWGVPAEWFPGQTAAQFFILDTALTVGLAILFWGWLAGWWAARSNLVVLTMERPGASVERR
jgi:putative zinc finger protein